jgi:hypothetical protein
VKLVSVNSVIFELGVGTRCADCFWSNDLGKTALGMQDQPSKNARLFWNVLLTGRELVKTDSVAYCGNPIEFDRVVNWRPCEITCPKNSPRNVHAVLSSFANKLESIIEELRPRAKAVRRELAKLGKRLEKR